MEKKNSKTINKVLTTIGITGTMLATGGYATVHADSTPNVNNQSVQSTTQADSKVSQDDLDKVQTDAEKSQTVVNNDNNQITAQQGKVSDTQKALNKAQQSALDDKPEKNNQTKTEIYKQNDTVKNDIETVKHDQASVDHYQAGINSAQQNLNDAQAKVNIDQSTVDNTQTQINNFTNQTQDSKITVPSANIDEMKSWTSDQCEQWASGIKAVWHDDSDLTKESVDLNNVTKAQYDEMQNQLGTYINQVRTQLGAPQIEVGGDGMDSLMEDVIDGYNTDENKVNSALTTMNGWYDGSVLSAVARDYKFGTVQELVDYGFSKDTNYKTNQLSMNDVNHMIFSSVVNMLNYHDAWGFVANYPKHLVGCYDTGIDNPTGAQSYYGIAFTNNGFIHIDGGHVNPSITGNSPKPFDETNAYNPLINSQAKVDTLTDQLHQQKATLDNDKNKLVDAQSTLQEQKLSLNMAENQLANSQKQLQDDQDKLTQLQQQLSDSENASKLLSDAEKQLQDDQDKLAQLQAQKAADEATYHQAQNALDNAKANLTKVQNQYAAQQAVQKAADDKAKVVQDVNKQSSTTNSNDNKQSQSDNTTNVANQNVIPTTQALANVAQATSDVKETVVIQNVAKTETQSQVEVAKPVNPGTTNTANDENKEKSLPNTGTTRSSSLIAMIGMIMISLAGLFGLSNYRKEK